MPKQKKCFFIIRLGKLGSDIRKRADELSNIVIGPMLADMGYELTRADLNPNPGLITPDIFADIRTSELVIADLTGGNPNVFYELALRHVVGKACITIMDKEDPLPFDVKDLRTLEYSYADLTALEEFKKHLKTKITYTENYPDKVSNPIVSTLKFESMALSEDTTIQNQAEILSQLRGLQISMRGLYHFQGKTTSNILTGPHLHTIHRIADRSLAIINEAIESDPPGQLSLTMGNALSSLKRNFRLINSLIKEITHTPPPPLTVSDLFASDAIISSDFDDDETED